MFAHFRIPLELIYEAGVERVSNEDAREYGVTGSGDLSGLAFHHFDPVSKNRITTSIRRDHPPIGIGGKPEAKYLLPHGDSRCDAC